MEFYKLDYNGQSLFLSKSMEISEPIKRRGQNTEATSRRKCTFRYYLTIEGKHVEICLKTLCDTVNVTPRRIQILQDKLKVGITSPSDGRGKHSNRPHAIKDSVKDEVREHIKSLPKQPSHYSRQKSEKEYLSPDLNLSKIYRLFKEKYPNSHASKHLYQDIFNSEFNFNFGAPRSDTCKYCDELFIQFAAAEDQETQNRIQVQSDLHHAKAEAAYNLLKSDIEKSKCDKDVVVICVDLQQILSCPTLTHSSMYYQRQLSSYNFAIHNAGDNDTTMHLWYECQAKRGSSEIASCLLQYVKNKYKILPKGNERRLIVWSDRCVGQNNNWKIIQLYNYFVLRGYFTQVEQKFLVSGHSFLPCDRTFALIEKKRRTVDVMIPSEWKNVIAEACFSRPFTISEMDQNDFVDFSVLENSMKRDPNLKITSVMWLKFMSDDPNAVFVRKSHNILQPWERHCLVKRTRGNQPHITIPLPPLQFPPLYKELLPLTLEKKRDLLDMCKYIDGRYREFYVNLPSA